MRWQNNPSSTPVGAHTTGALFNHPEKCQAAAGQFKIATTNFSLQGGKGGGRASSHPSQSPFTSPVTAASTGSAALLPCAVTQLTTDFLAASVMVRWGSNFSSCNIPAAPDLNPVGTEQGQGVMGTSRPDIEEQGEKSCQQCEQETKRSSLLALITKPPGCRSFLPFTGKTGPDSPLVHHDVGTFTFPPSTFPT